MTQVGEGVGVPGVLAPDEKPKDRHGCDWKNCPKKDGPAPERAHAKKVAYPEGSDLARCSLTLSNVHPDEKNRFDEAGIAQAAIHHLVPISALDGPFPDLQKNAELAGYKINEKENLMALPKTRKDAATLKLQYHAGGHGLTKKSLSAAKGAGSFEPGSANYKDFIARRLTYTEMMSLTKCDQDDEGTGEPQSKWLNDRLELDSNRIRSMISSRKILLVKGN